MRINTHGLTMRGLKAAAMASRLYTGHIPGQYLQISYDRADGQTLYNAHMSPDRSSWTQYRVPSVIHVVDLDRPASMQQIADTIAETVNRMDARPADVAPASLLKAARLNAGMTQTQAADALHLPQSQIAAWENGVRNPKIESLKKLSDLYRCPVADLIG